ncbi:MAG TPA: hypothetical protein VFZ05_03150 [Nitrososphaera sp.]
MSGKKGGKRDDSYFATERRKNKNTRLLLIAAGIGVVIAAVAAAFAYQSLNPPLVAEHEHAVFAIILNGQKIDFSQAKYQVEATRSPLIHMEGGDGTTLHRHVQGVTFGQFLDTVNMRIQDGCFVRDDGAQFCEGGGNQLRFFINGEGVDSITDYVLQEEDRFLVIYGNQTDEEIQQELTLLDETPIRK